MSFVRPDVANLLAMLASAPGPKMEEGTPAAARAMMLAMKGLTERPRGPLAHVRDFTIPSAPRPRDPGARLWRRRRPRPGTGRWFTSTAEGG